MYHDTLLSKAIARLPALQRPHPNPHNRYTQYWTKSSTTYRRLATLLQMIQYTELLWEMAARRKGETVRWRIVVVLEIVKAVCRLLLLRLTNSRPLLSPPLPERDVDPSKIEESAKDPPLPIPTAEGIETPQSERSSSIQGDDAKWTMPRTGLTMPSLPDTSDVSNYLLSKVLTADDVKPPKALLHRVTGKGEIAEILYIVRPVVYAMAMQQWSTGPEGKRNWRPWLLGFGMEYGARQLAKRDFAERLAGGLRGLTGLEKEELRKRGWGLGWWAMRGAFYETVTRYVLSTTRVARGGEANIQAGYGFNRLQTSSGASRSWISWRPWLMITTFCGISTTSLLRLCKGKRAGISFVSTYWRLGHDYNRRLVISSGIERVITTVIYSNSAEDREFLCDQIHDMQNQTESNNACLPLF